MSATPFISDRRVSAYIRHSLASLSRRHRQHQAVATLLEPLVKSWIACEGGPVRARRVLRHLLRYPEDFTGAQGRCDEAILRAALRYLEPPQGETNAQHLSEDAADDGDRRTPPREVVCEESWRPDDESSATS